MTDAAKRKRFFCLAGGFLLGLTAAALIFGIIAHRPAPQTLPPVDPLPFRLAPVEEKTAEELPVLEKSDESSLDKISGEEESAEPVSDEIASKNESTEENVAEPVSEKEVSEESVSEEVLAKENVPDWLGETERLRHELDDLKRAESPDDAFYHALDALCERAERLEVSAQEAADPEAKKCGTFCGGLIEFARKMSDLRALYADLDEYAAVCGDQRASEEFLRRFIRRWPGTEYADDFARVLGAEEIRPRIDDWNRFIERSGASLSQFALSPEESFGVVDFYAQNAESLAFLPEWPLLQKRTQALAVSARGVPIRDKAVEIFNARSTPYSIYRTSDDRRHYLIDPPVAGENRVRADLFGGEKRITLRPDELDRVEPDRQGKFFAELAASAAAIPDELRFSDPARWYAAWSGLAEKLRTAESLDPLVQFFAVKDLIALLSSADYYFDRQFDLWEKTVASEAVPEGLDYFDAENKRVADARREARSLLAFLPPGVLAVDKSTAELNDSVPNIRFFYRVVGWLDQDLSGVWRLRPSRSVSASGALYVFRLDDRNEPEAFSVGAMENGAAHVAMIGTGLLRGLPVYLRTDDETVLKNYIAVSRLLVKSE